MTEKRNAWLSVSATTRPPRPREVEGIHYRFVPVAKFEEWIKNGGLLEWAQVHAGQYYGTPRGPVEKHLEKGNSVFLEIDTQGAFQVLEAMPDAVTIFIEPPSVETLKQRLVARGTETSEQIAGRIEVARREMAQSLRYNYLLVNDDLDDATAELARIINKEEKAF